MQDLSELDGTTVWTSSRLRCRRWYADDLEAIHRIYSDPEVVRFVGDGEPITAEESEHWLSVTARNYRERGYGMFALERIDSAALVGFCGLVHPGGQAEVEVKYALAKSFWGSGLATELVQATTAYAFDTHGPDSIIATVHPDNLASQRVLSKAGFELSQTRRDDDGEPEQLWTLVRAG